MGKCVISAGSGVSLYSDGQTGKREWLVLLIAVLLALLRDGMCNTC